MHLLAPTALPLPVVLHALGLELAVGTGLVSGLVGLSAAGVLVAAKYNHLGQDPYVPL